MANLKKARVKPKVRVIVKAASQNGPRAGIRVCPHCGHIVPPHQEPKSTGLLTDRQMEVLRLIAMGSSAQQIADELGVSRRTAEYHRGSIMLRLGVKTTAELVIYALANQVIRP